MTTYHSYSPFLSFPCEGWSLTHSCLRTLPPEPTGRPRALRDGEHGCNISSVTETESWERDLKERRGNSCYLWGFPNCSVLFGCLIMTTFLTEISGCLINDTYIRKQRSRKFFSRTPKWQRQLQTLLAPSAESSNRWQISPVYRDEGFKMNHCFPVQPGGQPHVIIHPLFSTNGPRLGKQGLWRAERVWVGVKVSSCLILTRAR